MVFIFCDVSKLLSFSERLKEKSIINNADKNKPTILTVYSSYRDLIDQ